MIQTFISAFLKLGSFSCFIFYLLRVGRCEFFLLLLLFGFVAERQKNSEATGWSQVSLFGGISENRRVCWRWRCWTFGTIKPLMAALLKENSETCAKTQRAFKIEIQARSHILFWVTSSKRKSYWCRRLHSYPLKDQEDDMSRKKRRSWKLSRVINLPTRLLSALNTRPR